MPENKSPVKWPCRMSLNKYLEIPNQTKQNKPLGPGNLFVAEVRFSQAHAERNILVMFTG